MYKQRSKRVQYPCTVCRQECGEGTIQCSGCGEWTHAACMQVDENFLISFRDLDFYCPECSMDRGSFKWDASLKRYTIHMKYNIILFL